MPHAARLTALSSPSTDRWPLASTVSDPRRGPGRRPACCAARWTRWGSRGCRPPGWGSPPRSRSSAPCWARAASTCGTRTRPRTCSRRCCVSRWRPTRSPRRATRRWTRTTPARRRWRSSAGWSAHSPAWPGSARPRTACSPRGGSMSNLLAVLIARDLAAARAGVDARRRGVHGLTRPVVFCSELAHFSVQRACAALGLGEDAVVTIGTDQAFRMRPDLLAAELRRPGRTPVAIVATAGTTDYGSVDPLTAIAELARAHRTWLHVDAAYGFGALFSGRLAPLLDGLALADSVTLDLHKIGWQPAATSVLLVADRNRFAALDRSVDYLNPPDDVDAGLDGLLGRSLQTTRRPDAVKVATTLRAYGRTGLGRMLDHCHELARAAAGRIVADGNLELLAPVTLTTVVFRFDADDGVQGEIRRRLLTSGRALIGRTTMPARAGRPATTALKLTLLNPNATPADIDALLDLVVETGRAVLADDLNGEGAA